MPEYLQIGDETHWLANNLAQAAAQAIDLRYSGDPELAEYQAFYDKLKEHLVDGRVTAQELRAVYEVAASFEHARQEDVEVYLSCVNDPTSARGVEQYREHVASYRELQYLARRRLDEMLEPVDCNALYRPICCDLERLRHRWETGPEEEWFAREHLFVAEQCIEARGTHYEDAWSNARSTLYMRSRILPETQAQLLYQLADTAFNQHKAAEATCRDAGELERSAKYSMLATSAILVRSSAEDRCNALRVSVDPSKPFEPTRREPTVPKRRGMLGRFRSG